MDKTIKTRSVVKDIKVLDKRAAGLSAVKSAYAKTKEIAERDGGKTAKHRSGTDYAQTKTEQAARGAAHVARQGAAGSTRKAINGARDAVKATKDVKQGAQGTGQAARATHQRTGSAASEQAADSTRKQAADTSRKQAAKAASRQTAKRAATRAAATSEKATTVTARQTTTAASKQAAANAAGSAKGTVKQGAKGTVKVVSKSVKTAGATAKAAVKTSQHTAQAARASAKASQIAARSATQAARAAAKATATAARAAARGIAAFTKMAIAAVKSLASVIAAGGGVAVVAVVIICMVALIAGSAFGIFFAGDDNNDGNPSLREVIARINQEHTDKIEQAKANNPHDELMLTGAKAPWPEVLAIFAVKVTTDADDPLDAITLDARRQQALSDTFWDMNLIETRTEDRDYTEIVAVVQADGTVIEQTETTTRRTLYITQVAKSTEDIAGVYNFSAQQRELLDELLSPSYVSAWQTVLYGSSAGAGDMVEIAITQLGNAGGQPYWSWYGFASRVEWCACFVSWCANEAGYIQAGAIPKFSYCSTGANWFRDAGRWQERGYAPAPDDIVFFDWGADGTTDHVGIVEYADSSTVHTIEGNNGDAVRRSAYALTSPVIYGYGTVG